MARRLNILNINFRILGLFKIPNLGCRFGNPDNILLPGILIMFDKALNIMVNFFLVR